MLIFHVVYLKCISLQLDIVPCSLLPDLHTPLYSPFAIDKDLSFTPTSGHLTSCAEVNLGTCIELLFIALNVSFSHICVSCEYPCETFKCVILKNGLKKKSHNRCFISSRVCFPFTLFTKTFFFFHPYVPFAPLHFICAVTCGFGLTQKYVKARAGLVHSWLTHYTLKGRKKKIK